MKKLFIGLLVLAAAGTAFYLLNRKKKTTEIVAFNKDLLPGKWKTVTQEPADSAKTLYQYEFQKEGVVLRAVNDSAKADTSHYEWSKNNELVWKEKTTDSTVKTYAVTKLTSDTLQLETEKQTEKLMLIKVK